MIDPTEELAISAFMTDQRGVLEDDVAPQPAHPAPPGGKTELAARAGNRLTRFPFKPFRWLWNFFSLKLWGWSGERPSRRCESEWVRQELESMQPTLDLLQRRSEERRRERRFIMTDGH